MSQNVNLPFDSAYLLKKVLLVMAGSVGLERAWGLVGLGKILGHSVPNMFWHKSGVEGKKHKF